MKEPYGEGVATHSGPEPCVVVREGGGEASVGARAGRTLSREIMTNSGAPTLSEQAEGHTGRIVIARCSRAPRGPRPQARTETPCAGAGRSHEWPQQLAPRSAP